MRWLYCVQVSVLSSVDTGHEDMIVIIHNFILFTSPLIYSHFLSPAISVCLSVCCVCLSVCLSAVSVRPSVCLSVCCVCLPVCCVCLSLWLSLCCVCLSLWLCVCYEQITLTFKSIWGGGDHLCFVTSLGYMIFAV